MDYFTQDQGIGKTCQAGQLCPRTPLRTFFSEVGKRMPGGSTNLVYYSRSLASRCVMRCIKKVES